MAIGTPVDLGHNSGDFLSGARTLAITSLATVPAGQLSIIAVGVNGHCTIQTPTDAAGNTWALVNTAATGSLITDTRLRIYCSGCPNGIASGSAITLGATIGLGGGGIVGATYSVSGVLTTPDSSTGDSGTGTDPSVSNIIIGASSIAFAAFLQKSGVDITPGYTESAGWTTLNTGIIAVTSGLELGAAYQVFASAGSKSHAPTTGLIVNWSEIMAAFDNALSSSPPAGNIAEYRVPMTG